MTTTEGEQVTSAKEAAGRRAADMVETGTTVGLGTGSTVWFTLVRLAERIQSEGLEIVGVPTSTDTTDKATEPVTDPPYCRCHETIVGDAV